MLENHEYEEVLGNSQAPYLEHLAERGAVATNYYGVAHPSLPNYLALLAGSTFAIAEDCTECVVLGPNLATHRLPAFSWLTPDLCNDGHDCGLATVDRHLGALLPRVIRQLGPHGLLVITFDEGHSDAGCCDSPGGGRVATVLVGPDAPEGREIRRPANHYSLLASIEDGFGLPRLRRARHARPLAPALFGVAGRR